MRLIGFNFTKVSAEKLKENVPNMKVSTKIEVPSVKEANSNVLKMKEDLLKVEFKYEVQYSPDVAKIELKGTLIIAVDQKIAKEALKNWQDKDNEKLKELRIFVFNLILRKANIKALELEEEFNLLPHLPLPSLSKENPK
jgi:hypothetical protein